MILPSNLVWLNGIAKLYAFEGEGSKWQNENLDLDTSDKLLVRGFVLTENLELKRIFEHTS